MSPKMNPSDRSSRFRCFIYILVVSVFSIAQGLTYPLFSFRLNYLGFSENFIGFSAMMTPVGVILSSFFLPKLSTWFSIKSMLVCGTLLTVTCIAALCLVNNPISWLAIRLCLGVSINLIYVNTEVGIMNESPKNIASYLLGLYVAVSNLGYAIGPAILTITGVESNIAFYVCIVIVLASSSPIAFINTSVELRRKPSKLEKDKLSAIFLFAREHPYIVLTSAAASFFDTCIMNMFPLFALSHGHSSETINSALFLFVIGGVASQIPISKFLNGFSPRKATFFLSIVLISLCLSLPHLPNPIYLLPVMCLIGGSVFSIQTCSLTTLSKEISDSARHVGNSSNAFFWALCNVVGIPLSGYLMKAFESSFLMYILIIPFLGVIYLSRKVADIRELAK